MLQLKKNIKKKLQGWIQFFTGMKKAGGGDGTFPAQYLRNLVALLFGLFVLVLFFIFVNIFYWKIFLLKYENYSKLHKQALLFRRVALNEQTGVARLLDGVYVKQDNENLLPFAVIIDNSFDARPTYGLSRASIVYETIAESGITRYLAIFDGSVNDVSIGPVRSVRPYYIHWAAEWDAALFHAGGSPEALQILKENPINSINEISGDGVYFYRNSNGIAPHNLFIDASEIQRAIVNKNWLPVGTFEPWKFKQDNVHAENNSEIMIHFSEKEYDVKYAFDKQTNDYVRFLYNDRHADGNNKEIRAKNIIIQYVDSRVTDEEGRLDVTVTGKGKAEIFLDNTKVEGYWATNRRRTRFFSKDGNEVEFNRGPIWIEVLSSAGAAEYKL